MTQKEELIPARIYKRKGSAMSRYRKAWLLFLQTLCLWEDMQSHRLSPVSFVTGILSSFSGNHRPYYGGPWKPARTISVGFLVESTIHDASYGGVSCSRQ
ncbi:hypothetical protein FRC18_007362 [Serendipita sp. 400]|nr:hypothetical protein FRC18_007362 [Serendipita sp. 400]